MAPSRFLATASLIACCGCNEANPLTPVNPGGAGPPASSSSNAHEGIVFRFVPAGDKQPVPNLSLMAWDPGVSLARVGARRLPDVTTDQSGRFRIMAQSEVIFLETAPGSAVKFHCPSLPHYGGENDVLVFDPSWSGDPWPGGFFGIAGKVVERVGDVVQPISGATVTLDGGSRDLPTTSNANGFFSICSIFTPDISRTVTSQKAGYRPLLRTIVWGWDESNLTLMLERN